jgi:DinB family protein
VSYTILDELAASQQLVSTMIRISAGDTSARVGAWSLRDIAAHLAASEKESFEPRIHSIAAGERPSMTFYSNDERDFSGVHLEEALNEWAETRGRLLDYVRGLSDEERARTGTHESYGEVSVDRYLEIALEHDRAHLLGLERVAGSLAR